MKRLALYYLLTLFASAIQAQGIHESYSIPAGGIHQWIKFDGENTTDPILLFLHGGPGNSSMGYSQKFTQRLQKHFIVVQWDQRGTGKTREINPDARRDYSVKLFEDDALQVIQFLCKKFNRSKIFLVGHSWGGFLALQIALHSPQYIEACIAVAPMVHQVESEKMSLVKMKELASKQYPGALKELDQIKIPFENGVELYWHRKWLHTILTHQKFKASQKWVENWATEWLPLFNEASEISLKESALTYDCPIYFLVGVNDYQTHFELTKAYFETMSTPVKEFVWFNHSGHALNVSEPVKFQEVIISIGRKRVP